MSEAEVGAAEDGIQPHIISAEMIAAAGQRLADVAVRTPLLRFADPERHIWLKPEMLQPFGSFKLRCSVNAVAGCDEPGSGIYTASAGNFAQGLTAAAGERGIAVRAYVPESAAETKLEALRRLGTELVMCTPDRWWRILSGERPEGETRRFVSPCADPLVIAGDATIGVEIVADLPDVDTILVPFGGGGLISGIAIAAKRANPDIRIVACEIETSTPLASAWAAGHPVPVETRKSFVTGIGSGSVLPAMWPILRALVDEVAVVSIADAIAAVRQLAVRSRLVAEGAGAVPLAAAMRRDPAERIVAVLSGGNIDDAVLSRILAGEPA